MDSASRKAVNMMLACGALIFMVACSSSDLKPVDLYPEDMCSNCRMAISDPHFAAEIISESEGVLKFDDIGCLESYRKNHPDARPAAVFVKDFETAAWLPINNAIIVRTDVFTPMGSGKLAFSSKERSITFLKEHQRSGQ